MRLAAIAALAPDERRLWYEGEHYLLEVRLGFIAPSGTVLSLVNVSFLTCGDVPWPVSPTTPLTTPITSTMISNFLLAGLSGDEYRLVKQRLEYRFHSDRVQQWLPCIAERDQAKTVQRAQQVMKALAQL